MFDKCVYVYILQLFITLVSHTKGLGIESEFRNHNYPCFKGQNCFHKSLTSIIDEYIDVWMVQLVITLVSHTRGLRFESGFRHHNIRDRKGQNNFHKSLTSMFDECSDVQQLLTILVSHKTSPVQVRVLVIIIALGSMLQIEFTNFNYPFLINALMSASFSWLSCQSDTVAVTELSASSDIIIILVLKVGIVFTNH